MPLLPDGVISSQLQDRCMGHGDPPIRHHDHQIPQAQFEARVPAHAQNDDLSVEVPTFEQIFDRDESSHLFIIVRMLAFAPEPHFPGEVILEPALGESQGMRWRSISRTIILPNSRKFWRSHALPREGQSRGSIQDHDGGIFVRRIRAWAERARIQQSGIRWPHPLNFGRLPACERRAKKFAKARFRTRLLGIRLAGGGERPSELKDEDASRIASSLERIATWLDQLNDLLRRKAQVSKARIPNLGLGSRHKRRWILHLEGSENLSRLRSLPK
jgi:hypothetical protein